MGGMLPGTTGLLGGVPDLAGTGSARMLAGGTPLLGALLPAAGAGRASIGFCAAGMVGSLFIMVEGRPAALRPGTAGTMAGTIAGTMAGTAACGTGALGGLIATLEGGPAKTVARAAAC